MSACHVCAVRVPCVSCGSNGQYFLEQRWFKGEWTRQSFLAHPGSSVNGLKFVASPSSSAPATLVTCSDDHTVRGTASPPVAHSRADASQRYQPLVCVCACAVVCVRAVCVVVVVCCVDNM